MRKILFVLLVVYFQCGQLIGQDVKLGVKAGMNLSKWEGESPQNSGFLKGFHLGPTISLKASDNIFIVPSLLISQKGNMSQSVTDIEHGDNSFYSDSKQQFKFTYIELPVYAKFKIVSGLSLYTGPQFSYLLKATSKSESFSILNGGEGHFQEFEDDDLKGYNRFDLAVVVGIDYLFSNGINLNVGYDFGLYELEDVQYYGKFYNRVIKLSLGYYF